MLSISFLPLVGNDQVGPNLPVRLIFNPFSKENTGFGKGWYLDMTQYVPGSNMLRLHTGEAYKVTGSGAQPPIREKKLDSFHFHDDSAGDKKLYRVVHKNYLEEILQVHGTGASAVALPVEVKGATGHRIKLGYTSATQRLESIVDGNGLSLLKISYASGRVTLDLHPTGKGGNQPLARYILTLVNDQLTQVDLPAEVGGNWRFKYQTVRELNCLTQVSTPFGAVDDIRYEDGGHLLPGGGTRVAIPRVTTHLRNPGGGQPTEKTTYTYTIVQNGVEAHHNFVGNGSGISWRDDGEDNLYRAASSYLYSSTARQWGKADDGQEAVLRTTQRWYNRFHLQVREVTRQAGKVHSSETLYHGNASDSFEAQPGNFQLPLQTSEKWTDDQDPSQYRQEVHKTAYDLYGNLIEETLPSGQRTVIEYYPAQGEEGCPADPDNFVRNAKHVTEHPAAQGDTAAPVRRKAYVYEALARVRYADDLATQPATTWLVQRQETLCEVVNNVEQAPLQVISTRPVNKPDDLLRHGRPLMQLMQMGGEDTRTSYVYRKETRDGHPVLITQQRLTGFDHGRIDPESGQPRHVRKVITLETSMLMGEPLLNRDDNDVEIAYEYDAIRRVTRETVSPNEPKYKASRTYQYGLVSAPGEQAWQVRVDVKGVAIRSVIDGLGRVAWEERHDADAKVAARHQVFRQRNKFTYDELGQLTDAIEYDWMDVEQLPLATHYEYDAWGRQSCEIGPDGVKRYEVYDPIGSNPNGTDPAGNLPTQTSWIESADGKQRLGKATTWFNLFEQPVQVSRFDLGGELYSKHQYFYDGLGRNVREVDARNAVTRSAYDLFDRLVDQTLADKAVVHRDYAVHSSEDLPVKISVNDKVLGEQVFDGLNRMVESITGGRRKLMFYAPGQNKPNKVRTAAGREIDYDYVPQLGEDPKERRIPGKKAEYDYDPANARLKYCKEDDQALTRDYFSTGEVKLETRTIGEETWTMEYGTSLLGRQLFYRDVLGQEQTYDYDDAGRLKVTALGTTKSTFTYDALGNMCRYVTEDGGQKLTTKLEYDHQGREWLRRFTFSDGSVQELVQEYSVLDQMTSRVLKDNGTEVRKETYVYDLRGHLQEYCCSGQAAFAPKDPAGKTIREQFFDFDAVDNITWLFTAFDDEEGDAGDNEATYLFDNEHDPAQLTGVVNTHPDYQDFTLHYDDDGNMDLDEKGKILAYDALGRLISYDGSGYGYDPLDRLASQGA